jgi:hypothetical protein
MENSEQGKTMSSKQVGHLVALSMNMGNYAVHFSEKNHSVMPSVS